MFNYIEYRSIADMNNLIIRNLHKFPHDIDLVVGIPRSGMLPANLLALYLNKPFTDIDSFVEGRIYGSGERGRFIDITSYKKAIILDDSINSGGSLRKAQIKLSGISSNYKLIYAAVFATSESKSMVDVWCEVIDLPRIFQWNFFHHKVFIPYSCMDIDGVLCQNPPIDDDGEQYIDYITHAIPYFIPTVEIDTLVSCRLEKYRPQTEAWLAKHGIKYKHLIMLNLPSKDERLKWGKHGEYKGEVYKKSHNKLFIESSLAEAQVICKVSKKQVFCTENFEMLYYNEFIDKTGQKLNDFYYYKIIKPSKSFISRCLKRIVKCFL